MTVYSDDFNRANGALGSSWTGIENGGSGMVIATNRVSWTTDGITASTVYNQTFSNDQWAEADCYLTVGAAPSAGVGVRHNTASGNPLYYSWHSSGNVALFRHPTGGEYTQLGGNTAVSSPFKVRVEAEGTTIRMFVNDVQVVSVTDSSITSGKPGLMGGRFGGATAPQADNFRCGDMPYTPTGGGGPGTWTGTPATVTVTAASGTWSWPGMIMTWSDTAFVNINSGGNYETVPLHGGDTWNTGTAGQITDSFGFGTMSSRRLDAANTLDQYVKLTVTNLATNWGLSTHAPTPMVNRGGYAVEFFDASTIQWFYGAVSKGTAGITTLSGGGTLELRVVAEVATFYVNGTLRATKDFSAETALTRPHQGFSGGNVVITDAEGGDYSATPPPQTWTGTAGAVTIAGGSGTWVVSGGPQTWTGSAGAVTIAGTSSSWSVPSFGPWTDTAFVNINSGGDYESVANFAGDSWNTSTAGQVTDQYGFGVMNARRLTVGSGLNQYVKVTVNAQASNWGLTTHAPTPMVHRGGYSVEYFDSTQVQWFYNATPQGLSNVGTALTATPGSMELRVVDRVGTFHVDGVLRATHSFTANPTLTSTFQGFSCGAAVITYAEGGDLATAQTWTRSPGAVTITGESSSWEVGGVRVWVGSPGAVAVVADSGLWSPKLRQGFRVGPTVARALKSGATTVARAYLGAEQVWPPSPQTWTGTAATLSMRGNRGTWYTPGSWVFVEDFTGDLSRWAPARWRSEGIGATPGFVHYADDVDGADHVNVPNDVVISGSTVWLGVGSQNYGDTALRADQMFSFPTGGNLEVDAYLPYTDGLDGWTQVLVTSLPYSAPSAEDDNNKGPCPKYGFTVRLNYGLCIYAGAFVTCPTVFVYDNHIETEIGNSGAACAPTSAVDLTTVKISFTRTHVNIYANGVLWFSENWTLPSALTTGYVYIAGHNHASVKYRDRASYNARYGGVRFDGVPLAVTAYRKVPDSLTTYSNGVDIGWYLPTGALSIPSVPATVTNPRLICSLIADNLLNGAHSTWRLNYSLNGGTVHAVAFEPNADPARSGSANFSIPVSAAELVTGTNTVAFTATGFTSSSNTPYVGNVQLVYEL